MNERVIFDAASQISDPQSRRAYVEQMCKDDPVLLEAVESLLKFYDSADSFLELPVIQPQILGTDSSASPKNSKADRDLDLDDSLVPDLGFLLPSDKPGSIGSLGHFEVQQVLGQGAFGIVLKAFDGKLERSVAIKVIQPQFAATSPPRKRFLREARLAAAIRHENIVQVYSVEEQPLPYLVMEYIDGQTLQQKLDGNGPLETAEILHLGRQIASGLAAAHAAGLIHRDIKPGNILLERGADQKVKITDFGLARAVDDASLTSSGAITGTPMYMAPEQACGLALDCRADLFSLGSVLYQMACGRPPFRAESTLAVLRRVTEDTPRPLQEILPEIPDWLVAIVTQLHAKQPENRIQSAKEVAELLTRFQSELQHSGKVASVGIPVPPISVPVDSRFRGPASTQPPKQVAPETLSLAGNHGPVASVSPITTSRRSSSRPWIIAASLIGIAGLSFAFMNTRDNRPAAAIIQGMGQRTAGLAKTIEPNQGQVPSTTSAKPASSPVWPMDAPTEGPPRAIAPFSAEQAKAHQKEWAEYLQVPVEHTNSIGMKFGLIPPGEFLMGSNPDSQTGIPDDEGPQHYVRITRPYYIGIYEVTQGEYQNFGFKNHSYFQAAATGKGKVKGMDTSRFPVECVSLLNIRNFANRLSTSEGRQYRLPTEAEWEFACRAGTTTHFHWGDVPSSLLANFNGIAKCSLFPQHVVGPYLARTASVGSYAPNHFGLHDMHGNVLELCEGFYTATGNASDPQIDPTGSRDGEMRVARGGGSGAPGDNIRAASRIQFPLKAAAPGSTAPRDFEPGANLGFRLLLEIPDRK